MPVGGLRDVEAVENSLGLIRLRSSDVGLSGLILNDPRNEVDGIAVVMGGGKTMSMTSTPESVSREET